MFTASDHRIDELRVLESMALKLGPEDDRGFASIIAESGRVLELSDQQIADALGVSRPTISRWSRATNLPHRLMRRPILSWIAKQAEERVRNRARAQRPRALA
jgi:DNA-binding MurR/RpiR family transcriptional regulator